MRYFLLLIVSLWMTACAPGENACTAENHCQTIHGVSSCFEGYTWVDPTSSSDYRCEPEGMTGNTSNSNSQPGSSSNGGESDDFTPALDTLTVGAWHGEWSCQGSSGYMAWSLCPSGGLSGITRIVSETTTFENLAKGSYSIQSDDNRVSLQIRETTVVPSIIAGDVYNSQLTQVYYPEHDAFWVEGFCGFWMVRLIGGGYHEINDTDCGSSVTSVGGGDNQCGTDCDCGHCWYCDGGTCRYGGEGPYGCYRGCDLN